MDNQHTLIKGYRDLSQEEIDLITEIKYEGKRINDLIGKLYDKGPSLDQRWVSIGKTDLQKGIMALVRSVAQPGGF